MTKQPLARRLLLNPGHPAVYRAASGSWVSVTWSRNRRGEMVVPRACTSHPSWELAMLRVWTWYRDARTGR